MNRRMNSVLASLLVAGSLATGGCGEDSDDVISERSHGRYGHPAPEVEPGVSSLVVRGEKAYDFVSVDYNPQTKEPLEIHGPNFWYLSEKEIERRDAGHKSLYNPMPQELYAAASGVIVSHDNLLTVRKKVDEETSARLEREYEARKENAK